MRDTGWRIHFGVGLLGTSNLAEGNMRPTRVISSRPCQRKREQGLLAEARGSEGRGRERKRKKGDKG